MFHELARKKAIEALAESWASIDGKLDRYLADKDGKLDELDGSYCGYNFEAEELLRRLESRGYTVITFNPWLWW